MTPIRPKLERPPLIEQAITVVFSELAEFTIGDFGLFWALIRDQFDGCEAQGLIESRFETFGNFQPRGVQVQIVPVDTLPRCFYRASSGGKLVQVQRDRFTTNWMKSGDTPYPHSETTVARFFELLGLFRQFVRERGFGELFIRQAEITNVNIVPVAEIGAGFADAETAFNVPNVRSDAPCLEMETYAQSTQQIIKDAAGVPAGRLYTSLTPVLHTVDQEHAYRFELTARGEPATPDDEGAKRFFDLARSAINAGFIAGTTKQARVRWGEK